MGLLFKIFSDKDEEVDVKFDIESWKSLEYNDICIELANLIRSYRDSEGLSQKELAEIIGCDKRYIIKLEAGQIDDISFKTLIEIWTKLSTPDFNFGSIFLANIHGIVTSNYEQLCKRKYGIDRKLLL